MPKKKFNQEHNLQDANEKVSNSVADNELLNKISIINKEERQQIIKRIALEGYSCWLYMRTNLPDNYFISPKSNCEDESTNDDEDQNGELFFKNNTSQLKNKQNLNDSNGSTAKKKRANKAGNNDKKPYPKTLEGLEKEFDELKGKHLTYHSKLRKKGLYSRIIKKKRKEERSTLKKGIKNKLISDKNGNMIKIKPIKPIFNNEGKIVSSKFDFTESETPIKTPNKVHDINSDDHSKANNTIVNHGKKQFHTKLNGGISSQLNGIEVKGNVKLTDFHKPKVEDLKEQNKLSFEPVFNKESKMVFSKFEFSENKGGKKKKQDKDPRKLLDKIKEKETNLKELEASGSKDKAIEMKEKEKWAVALKRASGEKVRDDPELLKKSLRKEKQRKTHSQKKWQARIADVQKTKQEKQQKRSDNISARKAEKKKKKIKRLIKKGRYVPSF